MRPDALSLDPPASRAPVGIDRRTRTFLWVFGFVLVGTAGTGFMFKLIEFTWVATHKGADAEASFLLPVLNYLIVAAGYACLFLWAWSRGEFRDVEGTKFRMLEMQEAIDRTEAAARRASAPPGPGSRGPRRRQDG